MNKNKRRLISPLCKPTCAAFSLVEVVISLGLLAAAATTLFLILPSTESLATSPPSAEYEQIVAAFRTHLKSYPFAELTRDLVGTDWSGPSPSGGALAENELYFVATRDGAKILRTNENPAGDLLPLPPQAAENLLSATQPGIAQRDRYFHISLRRDVRQPYAHGEPPTLIAEIIWPFRQPLGPSGNEAAFDAAPSQLAEDESRERRIFYLKIFP